MPHHLSEIEEKWKGTPEQWMIPTGQALREVLKGRFTQEFLDEYELSLYVANVMLRCAFIETVLFSKDRRFYLQNVGYTESPQWEFSGFDKQGHWFRVEMMDTDLQQQIEEKIHACHHK